MSVREKKKILCERKEKKMLNFSVNGSQTIALFY